MGLRDLAAIAGLLDRERTRRLIRSMRPADFYLLAHVYMEGGEIEPAIEVAEFHDPGDLHLEPLTRAVEEFAVSNPCAAVAHFHNLAEICIRRRGRRRYKQTCKFLVRARNLLR